MAHHKNTSELIDYWRQIKSSVKAPHRTDIDPGQFVAILPQILILGRDGAGSYPMRLAGGFVEQACGRTLLGENLLNLYDDDHRGLVQSRLEDSRTQVAPCVLTAQGWTERGAGRFYEIMLAPLTGPSGLGDRYLGLMQPLSPPMDEDEPPLTSLALTSEGGSETGLIFPLGRPSSRPLDAMATWAAGTRPIRSRPASIGPRPR